MPKKKTTKSVSNISKTKKGKGLGDVGDKLVTKNGKNGWLPAFSSFVGKTQKETNELLGALPLFIEDYCLRQKKKIRIDGLGTFEGKTRKARKGRNPKTGATIQIPQKLGLKFSPSASMKDFKKK